MQVSKKQLDAVLRLPSAARYEYFIKKAADWEAVWGLWNDEWAHVEAKGGTSSILPLWPAEIYAQVCATGAWASYSPRSISIYELLDDVLPSLKQEGTLVAIFMTPNDGGITLEVDALQTDLSNERDHC